MSAQSFLTPKRLRMYPIGALCGVALGFIVLVATSTGLETVFGGRLGGDFPAFYGAGRIVRAGLTHSLYDPTAQQQAQDGLLPGYPGGWIHFAYPPFVALAYLPFTVLSFKAAYVVHTCLMAACCVLALRLLRPVAPGLSAYFVPVLGVALTFYPLYRAVAGGQNSALSLLCAAGAIAALHTKKEFTAGLWLGAWLFKPQFAIPVALITAVRSPRILTGFMAGGAVYFLAGAAIAGLDWPRWWLQSATTFVIADSTVDRGNGISLLEVATDMGLRPLGWVLVAVVAGLVLVMAVRHRGSPAAAIGLSSAAAPLVSPHALYYDGALALVALIFPARATGASVLPWLAVVWILGAAQWIRGSLLVPPLTIALIVALLVCARSPDSSGAAPGTERESSE